WTITIYLAREKRFYWLTLIPAVFMTSVTITYLLYAPEGFSLSKEFSYLVGIGISILSMALFFYKKNIQNSI
ncbi:MAG: carbon starvation protein A, partial [Chlorobi bacterium]|nr:carbon starvation protein A [Chlorobiota bacterium]